MQCYYSMLLFSRVIKKDQVLVQLSPFKKLTENELELLKKPAEDYAKFLDLPLSLYNG